MINNNNNNNNEFIAVYLYDGSSPANTIYKNHNDKIK